MSHFVCNAGVKYHLFGESGGKNGLVQSMKELQQHHNSGTSGGRRSQSQSIKYTDMMTHLSQNCPYIQLPFTIPSNTSSNRRDNNESATGESEGREEEAGEEEAGETKEMVMQDVVQNMLTEVLKLQVGAILVSIYLSICVYVCICIGLY